MAGAMTCFVLNDALVKHVAQSLPGAQLIFLRGLFSLTFVLVIVRATGDLPKAKAIFSGWVALRALLDAIATLLFLTALFHLPIGIATAINMTSPLMITLLAPWFAAAGLGRPPWLATILGFVGVLLIVQPQGGSFDAYALMCLAATGVSATRDLLTRRVHADVPSTVITLSTSVAVTVFAGLLSMIEGWAPFSARDLLPIGAAGLFLATGYFLVVKAMRRGDVSVIAPFRYFGLLVALVIGFLVWGERPNALAWAGIVLLVGSGIYVLRHGRRPRFVAPEVD